jgi:hypothetical protein
LRSLDDGRLGRPPRRRSTPASRHAEPACAHDSGDTGRDERGRLYDEGAASCRERNQHRDDGPKPPVDRALWGTHSRHLSGWRSVGLGLALLTWSGDDRAARFRAIAARRPGHGFDRSVASGPEPGRTRAARPDPRMLKAANERHEPVWPRRDHDCSMTTARRHGVGEIRSQRGTGGRLLNDSTEIANACAELLAGLKELMDPEADDGGGSIGRLRSEYDDGRGERASYSIDRLHLTDHETAQRVDRVCFGAGDDVVGAGDGVDRRNAGKPPDLRGDVGGLAHFGLDEDVGLDSHTATPSTEGAPCGRVSAPS